MRMGNGPRAGDYQPSALFFVCGKYKIRVYYLF